MEKLPEVSSVKAIDAYPISHNSNYTDQEWTDVGTCELKDTTFMFAVNGIITGLLCVFGLVGNSLSIFILQRDPNNKVALFLLQSLAVADNLLLVVCFCTLSVWKGLVPFLYDDMRGLRNTMIYIPLIINPLGAMTQTATVWITVLLAMNRFVAICKPFQAQMLCTLRRAKIQVTCVMLFAIVFNIPMFFQYKTMTVQLPVELPNGSVHYKESIELAPTDIGHGTVFGIVYTNALYSLLVLILPLVLLILLNCRLMHDLHIARRNERHMIANGAHPPSEDNISIIMIIIIVVFIICQMPDRIFQIVSVIMAHRFNCNMVKERLICLCNLLVVFNSSSNFLIYYVFRRSFRNIFLRRVCFAFCRQPVVHRGHSRNSSILLSHGNTELQYTCKKTRRTEDRRTTVVSSL